MMTEAVQNISENASGVQAVDGIGTVNVNLSSNDKTEKGIKKRLTLLPGKNPNFVGREDELAQLKNDLASDSMVYIVNGIGGIGKSELAYKYLLDYEGDYQHVALFEFSSDQDDTLEDILYRSLKATLFLDENSTLNSILYRLQNLPKKCLLVFDNLKDSSVIEQLAPLNTNCDVLITTRLNLTGQKCLNLDILKPDEARELFQKHYPTDENIDDILVHIDYHSLFIELIAKTLQEDCLSLEELRKNFKSRKFAKIDRNFDKTFNDFLTERFHIESKPELKALLQQLAILPSIEIPLSILKEVFAEFSRLAVTLNELAKRGWLIKKEEGYKLHQIIKEFILANHPSDFEASSPYIKSITELLDSTDGYLNPIEKVHYVEIIDSILTQYSKNRDALVGSLYDSLWSIYHALGRYNKAIYYQETALTIRKEVLGEEHPDTATSYNNLGIVYKSQGNYPKALDLCKRSLNIHKKVLGEKHSQTATSYINLGNVYQSQGNDTKALELFKKSLTINKEVLGERHPHTATSYNNLGNVYYSQEKHTKALVFFEKSLTIYEELLGEKHPHRTISYNNLGSVYQSQGNYLKALEFYKKSLTIREEVFGEKHPETAFSYRNIGSLYLSLKQCEKANQFISKALLTYKELELTHEEHTTKIYQKTITRTIRKAKKASLRKRHKICRDI